MSSSSQADSLVFHISQWGQKTQEVGFFASLAHCRAKQVRKYTGLPYILHPLAVANIYADFVTGDEVTQDMLDITHACILHDVIEDTDFTYRDISTLFGDSVADIVQEVTDVFTPENCPNLNRSERKNLEAQRISRCSLAARQVKICDLLDNTRDIVENAEEGFAYLYLKEKQHILELMPGDLPYGMLEYAKAEVTKQRQRLDNASKSR